MIELNINAAVVRKLATGEEVPLPIVGGSANITELYVTTEDLAPKDKDGVVYTFDMIKAKMEQENSLVIVTEVTDNYTIKFFPHAIETDYVRFVNTYGFEITELRMMRGNTAFSSSIYRFVNELSLIEFIKVEKIYEQDLTLDAGKAANITIPVKTGYTAISLSYCNAGSAGTTSNFVFRLDSASLVKVRNVGTASYTLPVSVSVVYLRNY